MIQPLSSPKHIPVLDHLRGLAALLVFSHHFGAALPYWASLAVLIRYADRGVEMFFAISGFLIPYSMFQRGHRFQDSGRFLLRRMARLEPPYLAAIALILVLNMITQYRAGSNAVHADVQVTVPQILAHFGYLNAVLGFRWMNIVFWTLAIEFQFYLFATLAYPVISSARSWVRAASLIAIALLGLTGTVTRMELPSLLPYWLPVFALGMTTFDYMTRESDRITAGITFSLIAAIAVWVNGTISTACAILPLAIIVTLKTRKPWCVFRPLGWLGTISYSFYLLHLPLGARVISQTHRFFPQGSDIEWLGFVVTFVVAVCISYLFCHLVERPSQRWSKTIGASDGWRVGASSSHASLIWTATLTQAPHKQCE